VYSCILKRVYSSSSSFGVSKLIPSFFYLSFFLYFELVSIPYSFFGSLPIVDILFGQDNVVISQRGDCLVRRDFSRR